VVSASDNGKICIFDNTYYEDYVVDTYKTLPPAEVSSSAAFEMLVGHILNNLYNGDLIAIERLAKTGQFAENVYWEKASGLLDQMACGFGGLVRHGF
jgi:galactokinase